MKRSSDVSGAPFRCRCTNWSSCSCSCSGYCYGYGYVIVLLLLLLLFFFFFFLYPYNPIHELDLLWKTLQVPFLELQEINLSGSSNTFTLPMVPLQPMPTSNRHEANISANMQQHWHTVREQAAQVYQLCFGLGGRGANSWGSTKKLETLLLVLHHGTQFFSAFYAFSWSFLSRTRQIRFRSDDLPCWSNLLACDIGCLVCHNLPDLQAASFWSTIQKYLHFGLLCVFFVMLMFLKSASKKRSPIQYF